MKSILLVILSVIFSFSLSMFSAQSMQLAVLKYNGGGDYYANPTAVPNLIKFCNKELKTNISEDVPYVEAANEDIYLYPFIHMTGHGNVVFSRSDIENLRTYLLGGGFLHIDDNYGMDEYIRVEIKKLFPQKKLIELPSNYKLFTQKYKFNGIPKIHEHDGKPAQAFGIFEEDRLILLYTYETDLGDGWEDPDVHNDPPDMREKALQMGANIIQFAFTQ